MKKFLSMLLAMAMVLGMSMTTFAAGETPNQSNSMKVTISNVDASDTLTAYQIVKADYSGNQFTGRYSWLIGFTLNEGKPNAKTIAVGDRVTDLETLDGLTAEVLAGLSTTGLTSKDAKTEELNAGSWMLIAESTTDAGKVYNPMLVSVYYTTEGEIAQAPLDAEDDWDLAATTAYAKSSNGSEVDKKVIKTDGTADDNTSQVGSTVTFELTGLIPSYGTQYPHPSYKLTDTIVRGLEYASVASVTVGGKTATYTLTYYDNTGAVISNAQTGTEALKGAKSFSINFDETYIKGLVAADETNRTVRVTYDAKVTSEAATSEAGNTVKVEYTRTPGENGDSGEEEKTVYVYTVSIDGVLQKVDGNGNALDGAVFTLFDDAACTNATDSIEPWVTGSESTDEDAEPTGSIHFSGLDAAKTYYLKETAAPAGYSLNETVYTITFSDVEVGDSGAEEGKLKSYKVNVSYKDAEDKTITKSGAVTVGTPVNAPTDTIVNTTLASLPSTGGIGTTIFTIGGCAIMIVAAGLYFSLRRRTEK